MKIPNEVLTVSELIQKLSKVNQNKPVLIFAEGGFFPALDVQETKTDEVSFVEIGCGWASLLEE